MIGVDLANGITGVAVFGGTGLQPGSSNHLLHLGFVRGCESELDTADAVVDAIRPWMSGRRIRIEKAPVTAHGDVHHGHQAALGWSMGFLAGLVIAKLQAESLTARSVALVDVSEWRDRMLLWSTRWGFPIAKPPKEPPPLQVGDGEKPRRRSVRNGPRKGHGEDFLVGWEGCDHEQVVANYADLMALGATRCPECAVELRRKVSDPAEWRRQEWKRIACAAVAHHWPEEYAALVAPCRGRARTAKADHELVGVPDACEAVWIAISALELR